MSSSTSNKSSRAEALLQQAHAYLQQKDYTQALGLLHKVLDFQPFNLDAKIALARCQLALDQYEAAIETYSQVLEKRQNPTFVARGEAELVLGKSLNALKHLESSIQYDAQNTEAHFLAAVAAYVEGFIRNTYQHLKESIDLGFEWEDDEPVDFIIQYTLTPAEFTDFEHIYLDAQESAAKGEDVTKNRWFSLNIPVYDLFTASTENKQEKSARILARLISPQRSDIDFDKGENELKSILTDFAKSQVDAVFGLEGLEQMKAKNYSRIAGMILALQLEHLRQFSEHFALSKSVIENSNLQNLVVLLPLPMSISIMFLYAASDPKDQLLKMAEHRLKPGILAGLIALSFQSFYQTINKYRSSSKSAEE